jgi:hypothetical protein
MKSLVEYEFLKASGFCRGSKKLYSLVRGCSLNLVDTLGDPIPRGDGRETPKSKVGLNRGSQVVKSYYTMS